VGIYSGIHWIVAFSEEFREQFRDLLIWRRDVRRFRPEPLPEGLLDTLLELTRLAPSVGLSEPWRFSRVETEEARAAIRLEFETANREALAGYSGEQAGLYSRLKLAGLVEAPVHLAVFADRGTRQGSGLGRRTMPEMLEYSVVSAITVLWLAARAHGVGMGWVSILDPGRVGAILGCRGNGGWWPIYVWGMRRRTTACRNWSVRGGSGGTLPPFREPLRTVTRCPESRLRPRTLSPGHRPAVCWQASARQSDRVPPAPGSSPRLVRAQAANLK